MKTKVYDLKYLDNNFLNALETHKTGDNQKLMFNVTNDYVGRTFIAMIKKALNRDRYSIRVRGSQSDRLSYKSDGIKLSDQSVPLKYADRLRVYIEDISNNAEIKELKHKANAYRVDFESAIESLNELKVVNNENASELRAALKEVVRLEKKYSHLTVIEDWEDSPLVVMAKALYNGSNALQVLKALKDATGLGLRDAKVLYDHLIKY